MIKLIKIEEAKPGMKVARDIVDTKGNLLSKGGVVLSPELLQRIKVRPVTHVFIEEEGGAAAGLTEEQVRQRQEQIEADLTASFGDAVNHPVMKALYESAKKILKERAGGGA